MSERSIHTHTDLRGNRYQVIVETNDKTVVFDSLPPLAFDVAEHRIPLKRSEPYTYSMTYRIENGVLYWYAGDTFRLNLNLTLKDTTGETVTVGAEDTLELTFYDRRRDTVKTLTWTGDDAADGFVTVVMDESVSALFPAGRYSYDLRLLGEERTTLIRGGRIIVE